MAYIQIKKATFLVRENEDVLLPHRTHQPPKFCEPRLRTLVLNIWPGPIAWGRASQVTWVKIQVLIQHVHPFCISNKPPRNAEVLVPVAPIEEKRLRGSSWETSAWMEVRVRRHVASSDLGNPQEWLGDFILKGHAVFYNVLQYQKNNVEILSCWHLVF